MKNNVFKIYKNETGSLLPFSFEKDIPFRVKRIFIIYGKKNSKRADHAHHKCSQYLFPIYGSINVKYENKKGKFSKIISFKKRQGLLLKPKTWCKIKFLTNNAILLVACDMEYEFRDYIENYSDFLKIIKKNK